MADFSAFMTHPNTVAHEFCTFLQSAPIGIYTTARSRGIFRGWFPEAPDSAVCVAVGAGPMTTLGLRMNVRFQARAVKKIDAQDLIWRVFRALGSECVLGGSGSKQLLTSRGILRTEHAPGDDYMFLDDSKRSVYVLNYGFQPT